MGQPYTRICYYHLYLNGQYWGLYQTQERSEKDYAESYFGGDESDYDVFKKDGLLEGSDEDWNTLWQLAAVGFETDAAYYYVQGKNPDGTDNPEYEVHVDIDNLIDYMNVIFYTGSFDGPITAFGSNNSRNNFYAICNRNGREGWQFFCHDLEHSMMDMNEDRTGPFHAGETLAQFNPQWLHQQLMGHPEYRMRFADAVYEFYFNGGLLTPDGVRALAMARAEQIETAIIAESARWGDQHNHPPLDKNTWDAAIAELVDDYMAARSDIVLQQLRDAQRYDDGLLVAAPLYPGVTAPAFNQHGGLVAPDFELSMNAGGQQVLHETILVGESAPASALVRTGGALGATWTLQGFNDVGWLQGTNAVGYERASGFEDLIGLDLLLAGGDPSRSIDTNGDGVSENNTVYARFEFVLPPDFDASEYSRLVLRMRYDDSFIAYLNGQEVARGENVPAAAGNLAVVEVNYHPHDGNEAIDDPERFEFLELLNTGPVTVDLVGVRLAGEIAFDFLQGSVLTLLPGERVVVAKDPAALPLRYGKVANVAGQYTGSLGNGGHLILLVDAVGQTIVSFTYDDSDAWPNRADGHGSSLEIVDSADDPGDATGDGKVDDLDAAILAAHWLMQAGASWGEGDFNSDGKVDDLDASILAANWQVGVPVEGAGVGGQGAGDEGQASGEKDDPRFIGPRLSVGAGLAPRRPVPLQSSRAHQASSPPTQQPQQASDFPQAAQPLLLKRPLSQERVTVRDAALVGAYRRSDVLYGPLAWAYELEQARRPARRLRDLRAHEQAVDLVLATDGLARTSATTCRRTASGSVGQAWTTAARSGYDGLESAGSVPTVPDSVPRSGGDPGEREGLGGGSSPMVSAAVYAHL